jgi:hypothetical protein
MTQKLTPAERVELFNAAPDDALFDWNTIELITCRPRSTEEKARSLGAGCIPFVKDGAKVKNRKRDVLDWLSSRPAQSSTAENAKPYKYSKKAGRPPKKAEQG